MHGYVWMKGVSFVGIYLNPGNDGFRQTLNGKYVDKTGLISYVNSVLDTNDKLTCVSRPRRFGKTIAAHTLCAYYDKSCNSRSMFEHLEISNDPSFESHLNKYDVIYLDITRFISRAEKIEDIVSDIQSCVIRELRDAYPGCISGKTTFLPDALSEVNQKTNDRFFFIIDEWDALFREAKENSLIQREYIKLLRGLFKGGPASVKTIIGAYMTGILPIKKYGTESALTDFCEYTMLKPAKLAKYVGFTKSEVEDLCDRYQMNLDLMEQWYDGYSFHKMKHIYSPNSVMVAIRNDEYGNYWTKTETYESLKNYITVNMGGLKDSVIAMLGGQRVKIDTLGFQNDMVSMNSKDDILTLLIHLGYLAFDSKTSEVYIPNLEVADSFRIAVKGSGWPIVSEMLQQSAELLDETIAGNSDYVSKSLDLIHRENTSILRYNDENSLACVLTIAYYTARSDYEIIRELPAGKGFADLAFIPHRTSDKPAMIIELKHDKSAVTALQQIKDKGYDGPFKYFTGTILLIGINYDKNKGHSCVIERYEKI